MADSFCREIAWYRRQLKDAVVDIKEHRAAMFSAQQTMVRTMDALRPQCMLPMSASELARFDEKMDAAQLKWQRVDDAYRASLLLAQDRRARLRTCLLNDVLPTSQTMLRDRYSKTASLMSTYGDHVSRRTAIGIAFVDTAAALCRTLVDNGVELDIVEHERHVNAASAINGWDNDNGWEHESLVYMPFPGYASKLSIGVGVNHVDAVVPGVGPMRQCRGGSMEALRL